MTLTDEDDGARAERAVKLRVEAEMRAIIGTLERDALLRVDRRLPIERRWLRDLRQYHGRYEPEIEKELAEEQRSRLFINQTRPKTNTMAARLGDLLFPTDDRNWGIRATPVPRLTKEASQAVENAQKAEEQAVALAKRAASAKNEASAMPAASQALEVAQAADDANALNERRQAEIEEAKRRCEAMQEEIDDQLKESLYQEHCREVIEDACKIGTGILKGPIAGATSRRSWEAADGSYRLRNAPDPRPRFSRVDYWHYFPDPDRKPLEPQYSEFERHLMSVEDVRRLSRQPGFDHDALRRVLKSATKDQLPTFYGELRQITGEQISDLSQYYVVWEWHGTLSAEQISALARAARADDLADEAEEADPLDELRVVIFFCGAELLKVAPYPMDSGDSQYHRYNLEKNEISPWGFGVPYLLRDPQAALNSGWRMMLDNSGLSSGPQIVIDDQQIEPMNGNKTLKARKLWRRKTSQQAANMAPAFETFEIASHQAEIAGVIQLARQFIDDEINLPQIAQGEQGARATPTLGGMSILMNSANVVFRRLVKQWDDSITSRTITAIYDWNMQFSRRDDIKGDYEVNARGSSVLLVREIIVQAMMTIAMQFGAHPIYGPLLKHPALLRAIFKAQMLPADEVMKTDKELEAEALAAANNPPPEDPRITIEKLKLDTDMKIAKTETDARIAVANMQYDMKMAEVAQSMNLKLDELRAGLTRAREDRESKERGLAVEVAMKQRTGDSAGGNV
ncbi:MAG: hypothetical protein ACK5W0_04775 [Labrys sp. (in: a-proteobacteria)]